MGVTAYLAELEVVFLNQLKDSEIPADLDRTDGTKIKAWVQKAFGDWFLKHREELLAQKWVQCGWANYNLEAEALGQKDQVYRIKSEYEEQIEAWLNDRLDVVSS